MAKLPRATLQPAPDRRSRRRDPLLQLAAAGSFERRESGEKRERARTKERKGDLEWSVSPALPTALGVGAKRIIKELKVLKSRCILARDVVFLGVLAHRESDSAGVGRWVAGERRKTRGSRVRDAK